jgi:hypothetical protein
LQATNITGHKPQKCLISGFHSSTTFAADVGLSTLKHIRTTLVSAYDSGRRRA